MDWQIGNCAFGGVAGHPFLAAIIENCVRATKDSSWATPMMKGIPKLFREDFYILSTTGPGLVSRTFAEHPALAWDVTILFPEDVCNPSGWHQFGALGVHQMAASLRGNMNFLSRRLRRIWEVWTLHQILVSSRSPGRSRQICRPVGAGTVLCLLLRALTVLRPPSP